MDDYELEILLKSKNYPDNLINWATKLYPIMCDYFGYDNTIKFFCEYNLVPRDTIGDNSGATYRDEKKIVFDWQSGNLHEALTLFMHEAAHAMGELATSSDAMLMEGHEYHESFFSKLEEGLVSDKQNEIEFGELNYTYVTINTFDDDDEFHKNDFKTQPTNKYTINSVYYKALQLLLGENKNLLQQNMFAKETEEKNYFFNRAISFLKEQLTDEEFATLMDCACVFTLNFSYHGSTVTTTSYLNDSNVFKNEEEKENYINKLKKELPKNYSYAKNRNLFGKNIFDSVDDLCSLTLSVLTRRLENKEYDRFSAVKEACTYLTKIDNNSEKLTQKTNKLKTVLFENINELFPQLASIDLNKYSMTDYDKFSLITQIISLSEVANKDANISFNYNDDNLSVSINDRENYIVKKKNIYSEDWDPFIKATPIGYRIVMEKEEPLSKEISKHSLK